MPLRYEMLHMNTPCFEHSIMRLALHQAELAAQQHEVPVGAIIVDALTQKIIAQTGNRTRVNHNPTAHAEMLAIQEACHFLCSERLENFDIYVTLEPCAMCAQAISHARLRRLYFGAYDPKSGGVNHGACVFQHRTCHHIPEIYGGIMEKECADLLKKFFAEKR